MDSVSLFRRWRASRDVAARNQRRALRGAPPSALGEATALRLRTRNLLPLSQEWLASQESPCAAGVVGVDRHGLGATVSDLEEILCSFALESEAQVAARIGRALSLAGEERAPPGCPPSDAPVRLQFECESSPRPMAT